MQQQQPQQHHQPMWKRGGSKKKISSSFQCDNSLPDDWFPVISMWTVLSYPLFKNWRWTMFLNGTFHPRLTVWWLDTFLLRKQKHFWQQFSPFLKLFRSFISLTNCLWMYHVIQRILLVFAMFFFSHLQTKNPVKWCNFNESRAFRSSPSFRLNWYWLIDHFICALFYFLIFHSSIWPLLFISRSLTGFTRAKTDCNCVFPPLFFRYYYNYNYLQFRWIRYVFFS